MKTTKHEGQGQSGPKIALSVDDLNTDERKVYDTLKRTTKGKSIADIAEIFRGNKAKTNSRVRNALRRLVRSDLAKKVERGMYVSGKGRSRAARSGAARATRKTGVKKTAEAAASRKGPRLVPAPRLDTHDVVAKANEIGIKGATSDQLMLIAMHMLASKDRKDATSSTKIASAAGLSRGYVIPRLKKILANGADVGLFGGPLSLDLIEAHLSIIATPRAA